MKTDGMKGHLDVIVLSAVRWEPLHGYAIIEAIRTKSNEVFDFPEGTIYPVLHRLERLGFLQSAWADADGGRRRRIYKLTDEGLDELVRRREAWIRFSRAVECLLTEG